MANRVTTVAAWSAAIVIAFAALSSLLLTPRAAEPFQPSKQPSLGDAKELIKSLQSMGMFAARAKKQNNAKRPAREERPASPTHMFFTGGIASAYLMCHLLLVERRVVYPVFISAKIDHANVRKCRRSILNELDAAEAVVQSIRRRFPTAAARLKPIHYEPFLDVSPDIAAAHRIIFGRDVGQYAGIAQWARDQFTAGKRQKLYDRPQRPLQLAVFLCRRTASLHALIKDNCERRGEGAHSVYTARAAKRATPFGQLFGHVQFRLVDMDGRRLHHSAHKHGFDRVLRRSWSCTAPKPDRTPCGKCTACEDRAVLRHLQARKGSEHVPS